ncbi:CRISPR-associated ring nuclease Csm6 [Pokkaliibacter plantistimulans]|uniref:CRISPR-associated ring nuclease Csm6 n=1 Tax=Pokkaliibacter plantistimulans TaxID=1635171 RepID=UPI000D744462|nr:CRISPR-associated ring nuclease Csm6 [Pokkaliibacter plantistimulans]
MKKIFLAVSGMSPQIVTETLFSLVTQKQWIPDQVLVLSTREGCERAYNELLHPDRAHFLGFCREWLPEGVSITFDKNCLHTFKSGDHEIDDIRSIEDSAAVADQIAEFVWQLTKDADTEIHASIAGGRKTMGFLLGYCMSLYGRPQDRLSHVLVSEGYEGLTGKEGFFYPTKESRLINDRSGKPWDASSARVDLHEIPILHLGHKLPQDMRDKPASFSKLIEIMNLSAQEPCLEINWEDIATRGNTATVKCQDKVIKMTPLNAAFYSHVVDKTLKEGMFNKASMTPEDFARIKQAGMDKFQIEDANEANAVKNYESEQRFITDRQKQVNDALEEQLDVLAERYKIKTRRGKGLYVSLDEEQIHMSGWEING